MIFIAARYEIPLDQIPAHMHLPGLGQMLADFVAAGASMQAQSQSPEAGSALSSVQRKAQAALDQM